MVTAHRDRIWVQVILGVKTIRAGMLMLVELVNPRRDERHTRFTRGKDRKRKMEKEQKRRLISGP